MIYLGIIISLIFPVAIYFMFVRKDVDKIIEEALKNKFPNHEQK